MTGIYTVAIIGAGKIASEFDSISDNFYLTHCHSILDNDHLDPIGIFDIDNEKVNIASKKWNIPPYFDVNSLLNNNADIILIAVPDEYHEHYLNRVIKFNPKVVVCEKPLTNSTLSSKAIIENYNKNNIPLMVSYQRRYDNDFVNLKNKINNQLLGKFISGSVVYSKGILHNGSHAIDILRFLFGEVSQIKYLNKRIDYSIDDPSISSCISFNFGDVHLMIGDERFHSLFEIDLIFEKKRYKFTDSGNYIEIFDVKPDPFYKGYFAFNKFESRVSTLNFALKNMWSSVVEFIDQGKPLSSNAEDSFNTQKTCLEIINSENTK